MRPTRSIATRATAHLNPNQTVSTLISSPNAQGVKWAPKTGPRAMVYNGDHYQARKGPVQLSRINVYTRQPILSPLRWKPLKAARHLPSYSVNTIVMPTRFEPQNDTSRRTSPAPSSQHGPAQQLQPPPLPAPHHTPQPHQPEARNNRETITKTAIQPPRTEPTNAKEHQEIRQKKENPST